MHYSENLSIKYHDQNFYIKLLSQGSIEQDKLSTNVKKFRFGGI